MWAIQETKMIFDDDLRQMDTLIQPPLYIKLRVIESILLLNASSKYFAIDKNVTQSFHKILQFECFIFVLQIVDYLHEFFGFSFQKWVNHSKMNLKKSLSCNADKSTQVDLPYF